MKGIDKDIRKKRYERNEAASIVADLFEVTPRYVRAVVADKKKKIYKGHKPNSIREIYSQYLTGKNNLINSIERKIKIA